MSHKYNADGVEPSGGNLGLVPRDVYIMAVVEAEEGKSKAAGDYQVTCKHVIHEGPFAGKEIGYHRITFKPARDKEGKATPGAGIALHWLSVLGQPHEGEFEITPNSWTSKKFKAQIAVEEYEKDGEPRLTNRIETTATWKLDEGPRANNGEGKEVPKIGTSSAAPSAGKNGGSSRPADLEEVPF